MNNSNTVADQDYLLLQDGRVMAVHGHNHPPGHAVGEVAFVPDKDGPFKFFDYSYRKAYVADGRGLSERLRDQVRTETGTFFDHAHPFACKSIVALNEVELHLSATLGMTAALGSASALGDYARGMITEIRSMIAPHHVDHLGLTGSLRLMVDDPACKKFHDFDVVFESNPRTNFQIYQSLAEQAEQYPQSRVYEHGKGWRMRLWTPTGLLCPFFRYDHPSAAPLTVVNKMVNSGTTITVTGSVIDNTHGIYLPTWLVIRPEDHAGQLPVDLRDRLIVMISHMRDRGDFAVGDRGTFSGELVHVTTPDSHFFVLSVVDGDDSRLETPPWLPY